MVLHLVEFYSHCDSCIGQQERKNGIAQIPAVYPGPGIYGANFCFTFFFWDLMLNLRLQQSNDGLGFAN